MANLYEEYAREKAGQTEEWEMYAWECFPKSRNEPPLYYQVKGGIPTLYVKGPQKGKANWRGPIREEQTVIIPVNDYAAYVPVWERKNNKCHECKGTGQYWTGWSRDAGNRYEDCRYCNATGLPFQPKK